jgi:hypothetical protein
MSELIKSLINNKLYSLILEISETNYELFLTQYFNTFEHEWINKSNYYRNTLIENICGVKSTITNFKLF